VQQAELKPAEAPPPSAALPEPPRGLDAPEASVAQVTKPLLKRAPRAVRPALQPAIVAPKPQPAADLDAEITALIETRE
jgi:hypothetical protein